MGNWNHHEFYTIRPLSDWRPSVLPENIALDNGFQYDSIQVQDQDELEHHLLMQACYGAGDSSLRHPVVLSELYRTALADPQGCKILLARDVRSPDAGSGFGKGKIIGSLILYHGSSKMNKYFPTEDRETSGLACVVAIRGDQGVPIVEGLISKAILILIEMGFSSAQSFIVRSNRLSLFWFALMHRNSMSSTY